MQIQLCEDDGDFHGGTPQLVVLVVKFDDGKTKRIPYPAEKSIAALYQDLRAIAPQVGDQKVDITSYAEAKGQAGVNTIKETFKAAYEPPSPNKTPLTKTDKSNVIEKEDIVTMVKLNERDTVYSGMQSPLMVGMDYRVIEIFGKHHPVTGNRMVNGYDVIDDTAATPERMRVFPDEIVLKSKRVLLGVEKTSAVEEILPCPACQFNNSLQLEGSDFKGVCQSCGVDIVIGRITTTCQTPACKKDASGRNIETKVSCFDVGDKYEGTCGKCRSTIEVPYAN